MMCEVFSMLWHNFPCHPIEFEGFAGFVVCPTDGTSNGLLAVKTEYWGAFPHAIEIALLNAGFHLCFLKNRCRWGADDDLDRKARFVRYVQDRYGLRRRCVPVGMSCGGLMAVKFAAAYPDLVSVLYLDAPVMSYFSCPCGFGDGDPLGDGAGIAELLSALNLPDVSALDSYYDMPMHCIPALVRCGIPVVMVAGDSDRVVPYHENGALLQQAYETAGLPLLVKIKPGCGHHPHGWTDPQEILSFILHYAGL
jgi:pimeloyl-ACP methyl ester carboxylesterase